MELRKLVFADCEKEMRQRIIAEAKIDLATSRAAIELAKNNDLACEIHIGGVTVGLCSNSKIIPALKHHIHEIQKFLKDEPNEWK